MTTRDDALRHVEQQLAVLLRRARRVLRERAAEVHPELQPGAYLALGHIRHHGPVRSAALTEVFDLDKAAVSRQVHHLVDLGLVARTPDPDDGRATLIEATEDAVRRMSDVSDRRRKGLDERLGDWPASEIEEFADVLGRYNDAICDQVPDR